MSIKLALYWAISFVLQLTCANFVDDCNDTYSSIQGLQCFPCQPGYIKIDDCGTNHTLAQCLQCNEGTYQPHCISANETGECRNCSDCVVYIEQCTIYKNAVCGKSNHEEDSTDTSSEESGFPVWMLPLLWFIAVLVISCVCVSFSYRNRQRRKYGNTNETNNDVPNSCDNNHGDRSRNKKILFASNEENIEYSFTNYKRNLSSSWESAKGTTGKVATVVWDDQGMKKDSLRHMQDIMNPPVHHVHESSPDDNIVSEAKISKEKTNKLTNENILMAVISPVKGADVNKCHVDDYPYHELTRERLQSSADSEDVSQENTENRNIDRPTNTVSPKPLSENQNVHVKELADSDERGVANKDIDWFKIFKDLIPSLPVNEYSWKFFAFELFHFSQQKCGLPKNIHNEVKKIETQTKEIYLAYFEVFDTWHRIMASKASLDDLEKSLERFEDQIIMQEFNQIKRNPPTKQIFHPNTDTSLMPLKNIQYMTRPSPSLITYAQHESMYETAENNGLFSHSMDRQFVQLTNFSAATPARTSQSFQSKPSRLALQHVQQRYYDRYNNNAHHKIICRGSKIKKKDSRTKSKRKRKVKMVEKLRKAYEGEKHENIVLIKKILPYDQITLSRQDYNKFLDYTVNVIMEHNNVTRKTVLSITYKAYTEMHKTKNGGRYILYSGSPSLKLEREQYDCLEFYVKHARSRVLKELEELEDKSESLFLFISYDGKSAIDAYQKHLRVMQKTNLLSQSESDCRSCSAQDSSSESESSEVNDMETGEGISNQISSSSGSFTKFHNPYNSDLFEGTVYIPENSENSNSLSNEYNVPIPHSATLSPKRENNVRIDESCKKNGNAAVGLPENECFKAENEQSSVFIPVEDEKENKETYVRTHNEGVANDDVGMLEMDPELNQSLEDFMRDIDKELECTTSLRM